MDCCRDDISRSTPQLNHWRSRFGIGSNNKYHIPIVWGVHWFDCTCHAILSHLGDFATFTFGKRGVRCNNNERRIAPIKWRDFRPTAQKSGSIEEATRRIACPCNNSPCVLIVNITKSIVDDQSAHIDIARKGYSCAPNAAFHPRCRTENFPDGGSLPCANSPFDNLRVACNCRSLIAHFSGGMCTCIPAAQIEDDRCGYNWYFAHTDIKSDILLA